MVETLSTPLMKRVASLLQRVARSGRASAVVARELLNEIDATRGREAVERAALLRYDIERAALNAYSEVQAERLALRSRQGGPLQQRDHEAALMAAIDAVDKLRMG
jgi:hypothetical protein